MVEYNISPYLADLQRISELARHEIGHATDAFFKSHNIANPDLRRAMFLAALDGMADLIQHGELGPTAIKRLHAAREACGIPVEKG